MSDLVPMTGGPPLAWDHSGLQFDPEEDGAVAWMVYRRTAGRPAMVIESFPLRGTEDQLRVAIGNRPGTYLLIPVLADGARASERVAEIELLPDKPAEAGISAPRMYGLMEMLIQNQQSSNVVLSEMLRTLTGSVVDMQRGSTDLLHAANTTIKVANGVEALEREPAPHVDTEDLAERLTASFKDATKGDKPSPWAALVPVGLQFLQGITKPIIERQMAEAAAVRAAAAEAEKRAQQTTEEE